MKTIIKLLIGVIIIIGIIIGGGIYALNTSRQVDTGWDERDFNSGMDKSQVIIADIEEINLETLVKGDFATNGIHEIDEFFTNEEMSALVSMANDNGGPIRDVKVSFGNDGEGEVSFKLSDRFVDFLWDHNVLTEASPENYYLASTTPSLPGRFALASSNGGLTDFVIDYITNVANNKPVYASGELSRTSSNSVNIDIDYLTVGRVPMTAEVINRVEFETARIVNNIISPENGFHIEELRVEEGQLYFKGTLPAEVEGQRIY